MLYIYFPVSKYPQVLCKVNKIFNNSFHCYYTIYNKFHIQWQALFLCSTFELVATVSLHLVKNW